MKELLKKSLAAGICLCILVSCVPTTSRTDGVDENSINTMVAQTVGASGANSNVVIVTATAEAGEPPTITPNSLSTATPNIAATATLTPTEDACNRAHFVDDVTIPDGSEIFAGNTFVKTWRIQNVGTCTWTTAYKLVTYSGDDLGAPSETALTASVPPGGSIDISVTLTAPSTDGDYQQNFKLKSDTGYLFATGTSYQAPLFVEIKVIHSYVITLAPLLQFNFQQLFPLESPIYNFATNYCSATWKTSSSTVLPCPGTTSDAGGFVVRDDSPYLQDGTQYTGPAIFTHPKWVDNGTIAGFFPGIDIQAGYHFRATLGCGWGGNACEATVQLNYSSDGGPTTNLTQWVIKYGDEPVDVDIDLSSLAGHNVKFILGVSAKGTSAQDWIHWVNPRVIK